MQQRRIAANLPRITRGALIVLGATAVVSLFFLVGNRELKLLFLDYVVASTGNVWHHGRVWTLVTSPFLELNFLNLLLDVLVMWGLVPVLERYWGLGRFLRFVLITLVAATLAGTALGVALGRDVPITGLSPFVVAGTVAFGMIYPKQEVRFFAVLPLTGRQFMFGMLGVFALFVVLQQMWEQGAAFIAAGLAAAILSSKKWSPIMAWRRRKARRARAQLSVLQGGASAPKKPKDGENWLN